MLVQPREYNQRTKTARFPPARTGDPLLDHPAAEIPVDQSSFRVSDRFAQHLVADASLPRETRERLIVSDWEG